MRQILIDRVRKRSAGKPDGGSPDLSLDRTLNIADERSLLLLDEALSRLEKVDPRQCQVVEMRFFAGMQEEDIAEALGVSTRTVNRTWHLARAWIYKEMNG
jgi:RNA polymerase sigma factor (TIGR02999 family)